MALCVLSWFDVVVNTVVGTESGWNEGSWSLHFTVFPLPILPPACCSLHVESRGLSADGEDKSHWWREKVQDTMKHMETVLWQLPAGAAIPWLHLC